MSEHRGRLAASIPSSQRGAFFACLRGLLLFAIGPCVCVFVAERLCLSGVSGLAEGFFAANYALYLILHILVYALVRNARVACLGALALVLGVSIANHFVTAFTGIPITFGDLMSAATGFSVAGAYAYTLDGDIATCLGVSALYAALVFACPHPGFKVGPARTPVLYAALLACALAVGGALHAADDLWERIDTHEWNPAYPYAHYGFAMSLLSDIAGSSVVEAPGYDPETLWSVDAETGLAQVNVGRGYAYQTGVTPHYDSATERSPHIIAVMNESFSDLTTYLDGYETDVDPMPYVRSLMERNDVVAGTCAVSSDRGTGTANSEFEFLTGNSMAYFKGNTPYVQFIDAPTPSLASLLRERGYSTLALHAYGKSGYNRVRVYDHLGFEEYKGIEDFAVPIDYARDYPTDETDYRQLIAEFEAKQDQGPQFIFNVTMQNHGGYYRSDYAWPELVEQTAPVVTGDGSVETYESSVRMADEAVKTLIDYFEGVDEPVVILFFGDHEPRLSNEFYESLDSLGADPDTDLEATAALHKTPFFMWSNYDWDMTGLASGETMSLNYLGEALCEAAGLELSPYQTYLRDLRAEHPVVTARYFTQADGTAVGTSPDALDDALREYQWLQYNSVFDTGGRIPDFYI